jgi:putative hydrolase of the HAD superfamily
MIRGVIFDLFHTLTGPESEWSHLPTTSGFLGIDRMKWDHALHETSHGRLSGEVRDPFLIIRNLVHSIDPTIPEEKVRATVEMRLQRFRDTLQRIPAANLAALKSLRESGLRLGLVSNADAIEVASWEEGPLAALFHATVISCNVGLVKPDPRIFRKCLEQMELSAEECLFVGDGGSNELVGAKEVGLRTVFISGIIQELWPERVPQRRAVADHHIVQLPEILKVPGLVA